LTAVVGGRVRCRAAALLLAVATLAVAVVYRHAAAFDLIYDDHFVLRPWSGAELLSVFHGTWDPTGANEAYYRPLTSLNQAVMFFLFGINGPAQHVVSLAEFATVAWLVGVVILLEGASPLVAATGTVLYVVHPILPSAEGAWIFNQMHTLGSLVVLLAVLVWRRCRDRSVRAWWPVAMLTIVGMLIKEDVILLLPALLVAQVVLARWGTGVAAPSRPLLLGATVLLVVLAAGRVWVLNAFGGGDLSRPWWDSVRVWLYAPYRTFVIPNEPRAAAALVALLMAGGFAIVRSPRGAGRQLALVGATFMVVFDLPLVVASGPGRMHLVVLGGVLLAAGGFGALLEQARDPVRRHLLAIVLVPCIVVCAAATGRTMDQWAPCACMRSSGPDLYESESIHVPGVPSEITHWVSDREPALCTSGVVAPVTRSIDYAVWGAGEPRTDGTRSLTAHAVVLVSNSAVSIHVRMRKADRPSDGIVRVAIVVDGVARAPVPLTARDWIDTPVSLRPGVWSWLRDMHRVDLYVEGPMAPAQLGLPVDLGQIELNRQAR
jgi:hypothetical protein